MWLFLSFQVRGDGLWTVVLLFIGSSEQLVVGGMYIERFSC